MPRDANGNYTLPPSYHVQTGDTLLPVQHNPPFEDVANALTNSVARDGRTAMTGDLQMGGNKVTNVAPGTNNGDALNVLQLRDRVDAVADFATVSDLLADNNQRIGYAGSGARVIVTEGQIITAQNFRYEVVAGDATEFDEETAGGVKLKLLPSSLTDGVITADAISNDAEEQKAIRDKIGVGERLRPAFITMPDGFDWPANAAQELGRFSAQIVRNAEGSYRSEYVSPNPPSLIGAGSSATKRYIRYENGSDSNDGLTPQDPLKTIDNADTRTSVQEMELAPGRHLNSWLATLSRPQLFMGCRGRARLIHGVAPSNWTSVGAGIYSGNVNATPTVTTVVNDRQSDEFGFPLALPRYASLAALQASTGPGFAHVSNTIYIRLAPPKPGYPFQSGGYAVPQNNEVAVLTRGGDHPRITAGTRYFFQNIEFWGGDFAFQLNGPEGESSSTAHVAFENCDFAFAYADGVSIWNGRGGAWFKNCRAFRNGRDGFNYHDNGPANRTLAIEDGCISLGNGLNGATDTHQGSTNHDNGRVIRINGLYGAGRGGDIVDINDSQSWNIGCAALGSRAVSQNSNNGWETQGSAQMWLDDCTSYGSHAALMARGSSQINIRDFNYDGQIIEDGGTIATY